MPPKEIWTDEAVKRLRRLWPIKTARRIAKLLGPEFTRNAVIGKANRLHLPKKNRKGQIIPKINLRQPTVSGLASGGTRTDGHITPGDPLPAAYRASDQFSEASA